MYSIKDGVDGIINRGFKDAITLKLQMHPAHYSEK